VLRNNQATDTANGWGGALLVWDGASVTIDGSELSGNTARLGGSIYNHPNSALTLRANTLVRNNRATDHGGGVWNYGTMALGNVTFSGNSAPYGGGVWNGGTATLTDVTFSGNVGIPLPGVGVSKGGGLVNDGAVYLLNVTFSGNSAQGAGGLGNDGTATLTNVTFSGNRSDTDGGALDNSIGTATLTNVTFSGNSAGGRGSSIYRFSGAVTLTNTIVATSSSSANCAGGVTNNGFNLASDTSCGVTYAPNILLGPLADNGGPTKTHMPQTGSPAIDHGANCMAFDQRGVARPQGPACDIGAVEVKK
jgi:predicted outer membrane repeat protein